MSKTKVSKIMIWPSRKINLGNYNNVELNAGIEIVFDKPVSLTAKEVKAGFKEARKIVKEEFIEQYKPYKKLLDKQKGGEN